MMGKGAFRLQCLLMLIVIAIAQIQEAGENTADDDAYEHDADFVDMLLTSDPFHWGSKVKVKYVCTTDKIVGVSLYLSTTLHPDHFHSWKIWRCRGNAKNIALRSRRVRIPLADDIAFRPSLFNKNSTFVDSARIIVWMVDEIRWWRIEDETKHDVHSWALSRKSLPVNMMPPYSRPYKTFRKSCVPWYWSLQRNPRLSDSFSCPLEETEVTLLGFPVAVNARRYGVLRSLRPFSDPELESTRVRSFLSPRFSVELWVYVLDYCPSSALHTTAKPCPLFSHISTTEAHITPVLLINSQGQLQVECRGPDMYVAHVTIFTIPRRKWVRILFSLQHRKWTIEVSHDKFPNRTLYTDLEYPNDVYHDDTEGFYAIGGVEGRLDSFRGYIGRVRLYRGRVMTLEKLPLPDSTDAMFMLDVRDLEERCQSFRQWWHSHIQYYTHRAAIQQFKHSCSNTYKLVALRRSATPLLLSCPRRPSAVGHQDKKPLARLLRSAAVRDRDVTDQEINVITRRLLDDVTDYVEEQGLRNLHEQLPRVHQSSCLGNWDATYTLAAFLNNGLGTSVQEEESLSLLMLGSIHGHRLCSMALGHRHALGTDGVPWDMGIAYMYFKQVGDQTREDRENHPEDQVATEAIRLIDQTTLDQQTDETGDVFMWLKYQAEQGVASAQLHLAHLYFWGSQGMRRNLHEARVLFQQGEEQGDPDSIYNLGMMDMLGRGGMEKNKTSGKERLKRMAEKKHPNAVSALGWVALEERNYTQAADYFQQAFQMNFMDAGYYLGHMYHWGLYPNKLQDYDTALYYYEWAALRGHQNAALMFAQFLSRGTPKMTPNSYLAMEWARFIAEKNSAIGQLLRKGVSSYREGNIPLAAYFYLMAADAGVEVANFNLAWLCEERKEQVTASISKECMWRYYNLTVQREAQFVDPYSYIKMGDYFWYGCQGKRNISQAAMYYAAAGKKNEPHALFNLAFMVEEGAQIPRSVWWTLGLNPQHYYSTVSLLYELYDRCRESAKSEAFIPCTLALYRVWLMDLWNRYLIYLQTSTLLGMAVAVVGCVYFVVQCVIKLKQRRLQLDQL